MAGTALLVAGGTGGHLFPALALREALLRRGWNVQLATDPRVGEFVKGVPAGDTHIVRSASLAGGNPVKMAGSVATLGRGVLESRKLLARLKPSIVVGFGGYPTVPPLVAARTSGLPILVHEQNAVVGRANKLLIRFGAVVATGFADPKGAQGARQVEHVGNPVRGAVAEAAHRPYDVPAADGPFNLLVFGGSQGARYFSEAVPAAIALLPEHLRSRLHLVQQARPEDMERAGAAYREIGLDAELRPFFDDMPARLADAHLVLSRAGASTVSELAVIGRPAILVPYPHALDHDQAENAKALASSGGAWLVPERELTSEALAARLRDFMENPAELARAAAGAKAQGRPDAAERLADLVERLAS
ncbi:UDP-N-acetylglucosamine-N-acetylmuramylpentapeptide N-acetylglucosamine transferase [Faunimonas pinastri]|uniref:UDP-N-acetylglucosamine--N-acetylmuramyl-(pentapeptide) pyrophosphoryl-undecaprenol N-acetylglucosamine transferase n=1 Tax=Faunimonas pinastri TaxID=1855383 RepID=A0A1H9FRM8_9HYPH|nr:undecaprenyldiphospho-muramoylpentapeptide beta-N-acetylglucosaminyltransferase [Faunimonas pinastri]SEQ40419.1 UDP-N-acetylglucosamine-N-acetylmuramylpentapeptide N-acetylglucosamine transferase [Faunimonas pinastri]